MAWIHLLITNRERSVLHVSAHFRALSETHQFVNLLVLYEHNLNECYKIYMPFIQHLLA